MPELNCLVSPAELAYLGKLLGQTATAISPLTGPAVGSVDNARLAKSGLLSGDALTPAGRDAVGVLSRATAYAGLVLAGGGTYEHVVYFDGTSRVALTAEGSDFRLQSPAPDAALLTESAFGDVGTNALDFDDVLTVPEAAVALGLVDLERRRELQGILDDEDAASGAFRVADLEAWLSRHPANSQWLAPVLRDTLGAGIDATAIKEALASLGARGALVRAGDMISLGDTLVALASRLLVVGMLARIRAGRIEGDEVTTADMHIVQSQSMHHLIWEADAAGQVHVQCPSSSVLSAMAQGLLTDPTALAGAEAAAAR